MKLFQFKSIRKSAISGTILISFLLASGCNPIASSKDNNNQNLLLLGLASLATNIPVRSAVNLVNESENNYDDNRWGLITNATLRNYVDNWARNKPSHIPADGKLIVLQLDKIGSGGDYVASKPNENVYVYELDNFRFNEERDTGLVKNSVRYQASGATTDSWLRLYGINLAKDLVVFADGASITGTASQVTANKRFAVQDMTRGIYWLRYWGADIKNLAILNGNLAQFYSGARSSTATAPNTINNGNFSVKQLRVDNTILNLPLEDIQTLQDGNWNSSAVAGVTGKQVIIDARPTAQWDRSALGSWGTAGAFVTTAWDSSGPPSNDATGRAKTYVLFEGNIAGSRTFFWGDLLDANGQYLSKSELESIFLARTGVTKTSGHTIVSQCRTNFEVQVNGFAALNILAIPTVYFDGSLVEWTSLTSNHPTSRFNLSPSDPAFRFRTDRAERSTLFNGSIPYNVPETPAGSRVSAAIIDRNATTTRKALNEDKAYLR